MKFSTSKTELQQALQKLSKATPTRSTLPILGCVFIESKEESAILRTTDLEITIQTEIPASLEEAGAAAIPLKTLLDITNELPETRVSISVDEKNRAAIITDFGQYDLMTKPPDEFPAVPNTQEAKKFEIPAELFKSVIDTSSFAVSKDELKPALTGVLFKFNEQGLTAVATDGHRLVKYSRNDFSTDGYSGDIIVPRKFLTFLSTQLSSGNTELLIGENHLTARVKNDMVLTRVIDERFPDYESVIPKDNNKILITEKDALLGAVRRVAIFSNKSTHQVALNLETNKCSITTEDPEKASSANENIVVEYEGDGLTIGYNADYLKDIVSHVSGDRVEIKFNTSISAALFSSESPEKHIDCLMLLMPIRLND